jgi:hypothetical protein
MTNVRPKSLKGLESEQSASAVKISGKEIVEPGMKICFKRRKKCDLIVDEGKGCRVRELTDSLHQESMREKRRAREHRIQSSWFQLSLQRIHE